MDSPVQLNGTPSYKDIDYKRPGVGFWIKDANKNAFFIIHEFVEGKFIQSPSIMRCMSEFLDVDFTATYLFEVETVVGKKNTLFRLKCAHQVSTQDGSEVHKITTNWNALNFFLLKFLMRTYPKLSFTVPGINATVIQYQ